MQKKKKETDRKKRKPENTPFTNFTSEKSTPPTRATFARIIRSQKIIQKSVSLIKVLTSEGRGSDSNKRD